MNKRVTRTSSRAKTAPNKNRRTQNNTQKNASQPLPRVKSGGVNAWFSHHQYSCRSAVDRCFQTPLQSVLICLVLAVALMLPAALYAGLNSLGQLGANWQNSTRLSAFLDHKAKPLAMEQLQQRLSILPEFMDVVLVTPEQAKQEFIQHSGLGGLLQGLESNPLPAVLLIQPAPNITDYQQLQRISRQLEQETLIDSVEVDLEWLQRLQAMMQIAQRIIIALGVLLVIGMLLNLANTIRLTIENRRKEIVVSKLVGATHAFIRRPFLYTGICYGLGGGVFAVVLLQLLEWWLLPWAEKLASHYDSEYSLSILTFSYGLFLIGLSALLGLLSSWLAMVRTLKTIEPE